MTIDGQRLVFPDPHAAHQAGVRVIYQEPEIVPGTDVAENIWVGELPKRFGMLDRRKLYAQVQESLNEYGFEGVLNVRMLGEHLSSAQRQVVEIMRAIKSGLRVLALDEPTSSLTEPEIERVFAMMRALKGQGVGIIFISHKLKEVMQVCDRFAILRDGKKVAEGAVSEVVDGSPANLKELVDIGTVCGDKSDQCTRHPRVRNGG